ncbi:hypothetical protein [Endozoicomonas numazuensis]|uniref:Uncharacterized protein n=1 Tax=Endozoicomonas numazuensis TaxID=1137799 RepID=A0A081NDB2_9GAMM|nr:hypothetical protein [Endozoicomonas numazuensis]KEQ16435.1 hypothetical protein GZ78_21465 [Endozoicomonas numazuensis]
MPGPKDRTLLAYICSDASGSITIDLIEVSKNGSAYHYDGELWRRQVMSHYCTSSKGDRCCITPLSRYGKPEWVKEPVVVAERAKERYALWKERILQ